jgi:hypothetical protein
MLAGGIVMSFYCQKCGNEVDVCDYEIPKKRYHRASNNANYTILADFGDELCLLREDINVRILMKRVDFEKYLKEIV